MSTFINYSKLFEEENGNWELKAVTLSGIAQEGIVLDAGTLNNNIGDAIQYYYNLTWVNKLQSINKAYMNAIDKGDTITADSLEIELNHIKEAVELLKACTTGYESKYAFINRIALAILNSKVFRISGETKLYKALRISGDGDKVEQSDYSEVRKEVVTIMAEMLEVKECPYLKPVNIKLNLKEVSQLVSIANSARARWTDKGIRVRTSKTIETEVALQCILFVCKNCFKMVIPVKKEDNRLCV